MAIWQALRVIEPDGSKRTYYVKTEDISCVIDNGDAFSVWSKGSDTPISLPMERNEQAFMGLLKELGIEPN